MRRFLLLLLLVSLQAIAEPQEEDKTLVWPDGTRYVGGVEEGKRSGKGTIYWKDGTRFVGSFSEDKRNGPGTMILPDGTVYNGYFENDKLVEQVAMEPSAPEAAHITEADTAALIGTTPAPQPPMLPQRVIRITPEVEQELTAMVDLWAAAWSEKNVVQYLDYYAEDFDVPGNQSRRRWEDLRRSRLQRPRFIDVELTYTGFEVIEPDVVEVSFRQVYKSNVYSDVTDKVLRLGKEGPYWKILEERSE